MLILHSALIALRLLGNAATLVLLWAALVGLTLIFGW